jgi:hypothetical protein
VPAITKIELSKPIESFAEKRGEALFNWAWETWESFAREVLQILEKDEIPDEDFVTMCREMTVVCTLGFEQESLVHLYGQVRSDKSFVWAGEWMRGRNLPKFEAREEIIRKLLEYAAKYVRAQPLEIFIKAMTLIVKVKDGRRKNERHIQTPNSYSRSVHRLGLERNVSDVLSRCNIKTLGDLKDFVKPPLQGGLRISSDKHRPKTKLKFNPEEKLGKLEGMDGGSAAAVMEVVEEWDGMMSPASLYV